jgi:cytochrome c-type biogenesis protein CcsB
MENQLSQQSQGGIWTRIIQIVGDSFRRANTLDYVYAALLIVGALFAFSQFASFMDIYEKAILLLSVPALIILGWSWRPWRNLFVLSSTTALLAIWIYHAPDGTASLARAEQKFFLKYLLSSQSAILWMGVLFLLSTLFYVIGLIKRSNASAQLARRMTWVGVWFGGLGMLVRWYESYLLGADVGHIPISNLYEVFVLFALITALFHLYYEEKYESQALGAFVMWIIAAAVIFMFWYSASRDAHEIQPLVPALQSWWMKIHVPANFIGYGTFALAAMVGIAYLFKSKGILADRLPSLELLDDVMYKAIAVGFAFFTIATILGALWAADAWGGYWSWDPKETWALIVWLNYAAWLHMRLMKGLRGVFAAWWAVIGLLVTTFAFIGVNMFLSGLHSYGQL